MGGALSQSPVRAVQSPLIHMIMMAMMNPASNASKLTGPAGLGREDKNVDVAVGAIVAKVEDVKASLSSFIAKMEREPLTWPSVLDSFAALSGQFSNLMKQLQHEKIPPLYNQILLPREVSSERDMELEHSTEGRVPMLHHEVVPDYLRTKLDLDLEAKQRDLYETASLQPVQEADVKRFNKVLETAIGLVEDAKEEWEKQRATISTIQPNSSEETRRLVGVYLHGNGVQPMTVTRRLQLTGGKPLIRPGIRTTLPPTRTVPVAGVTSSPFKR